MREVTVGIDIGTSYTKAVVRSDDGAILSVSRIESPGRRTIAAEVMPAFAWWACVRKVVSGLLMENASARFHVAAICISAIAPTLTVFDAAHRECAYSVLYSSMAEMHDGSWLSQCDRELADRRIAVLRGVAAQERFISPCITDLVGYLNWCLTDQLTINSISLAEMSIAAGGVDCEMLSAGNGIVPRLVAAGQQMGETSQWGDRELGVGTGIPVCGGCPDTMGSVVGAGLRHASEAMLYLGTFGSFMRLEVDVDAILDAPSCSASPFRWLLSVPGMGPKIESLSHEWFGPGNRVTRLNQLDSAAAKSEPGAGGSLFLVPRWKDGMKAVGTFSFVAGRDGAVGNILRRSRAALESLGYAFLAIESEFSEPIKVSGGGARSRSWLDALSVVTGVDIQAQNMCWEAAGTADIAARLVWKARVSRRWHTSEGMIRANRDLIQDNLSRARELYRMNGWM